MVAKRKKRDYTSVFTATKKEMTSNTKKKDERFWQPTRDKEGNGFAIIRFLPNGNPNGLPFKTVFKHVVNLEKKFFIEKCPSTIGKVCPICEWNGVQPSEWVMNEGKTYRKKSFISNILVVSDPDCPENEGKVFLFEFGTQIFNKLKDKISPPHASEEPLIYFHPEEGSNFKVKIKKEGTFATWNPSEFDGRITNVDTILEKYDTSFDAIEEKLYNLDELMSEKDYKNYDDIKSKFKRFLISVGINWNVDDSPEVETEERTEKAKTYSKKKTQAKESSKSNDTEDDSEAEENFEDYFKSLEGK